MDNSFGLSTKVEPIDFDDDPMLFNDDMNRQLLNKDIYSEDTEIPNSVNSLNDLKDENKIQYAMLERLEMNSLKEEDNIYEKNNDNSRSHRPINLFESACQLLKSSQEFSYLPNEVTNKSSSRTGQFILNSNMPTNLNLHVSKSSNSTTNESSGSTSVFDKNKPSLIFGNASGSKTNTHIFKSSLLSDLSQSKVKKGILTPSKLSKPFKPVVMTNISQESNGRSNYTSDIDLSQVSKCSDDYIKMEVDDSQIIPFDTNVINEKNNTNYQSSELISSTYKEHNCQIQDMNGKSKSNPIYNSKSIKSKTILNKLPRTKMAVNAKINKINKQTKFKSTKTSKDFLTTTNKCSKFTKESSFNDENTSDSDTFNSNSDDSSKLPRTKMAVNGKINKINNQSKFKSTKTSKDVLTKTNKCSKITKKAFTIDENTSDSDTFNSNSDDSSKLPRTKMAVNAKINKINKKSKFKSTKTSKDFLTKTNKCSKITKKAFTIDENTSDSDTLNRDSDDSMSSTETINNKLKHFGKDTTETSNNASENNETTKLSISMTFSSSDSNEITPANGNEDIEMSTQEMSSRGLTKVPSKLKDCDSFENASTSEENAKGTDVSNANRKTQRNKSEPVEPNFLTSRFKEHLKNRNADFAKKCLFDLQEQTLNPVWVCCDSCGKWRCLYDVLDPSDLPTFWTCQLNTNVTYSSCEVPEDVVSNDVKESFVHTKFTLGSVVWVKNFGPEPWPAMVDDDPDTWTYFWLSFHSNTPNYYHVTFFGSEVSRSWIKSGDVVPFSAMKFNAFTTKAKGRNLAKLSEAVKEATLASDTNIEDRRKIYCFAARYKGKWFVKK